MPSTKPTEVVNEQSVQESPGFVRLILERRVQVDADGRSALTHKTMCIADPVLRKLLEQGWSLVGAVTE